MTDDRSEPKGVFASIAPRDIFALSPKLRAAFFSSGDGYTVGAGETFGESLTGLIMGEYSVSFKQAMT